MEKYVKLFHAGKHFLRSEYRRRIASAIRSVSPVEPSEAIEGGPEGSPEGSPERGPEAVTCEASRGYIGWKLVRDLLRSSGGRLTIRVLRGLYVAHRQRQGLDAKSARQSFATHLARYCKRNRRLKLSIEGDVVCMGGSVSHHPDLTPPLVQ